MDISLIGCGRWGTFIGYYLDSLGHKVTLIGNTDSKSYQQLKTTRQNKYLTLTESMNITDNFSTLQNSDLVIISINSQNLRDLLTTHKHYFTNQPILLCMKGLEIGTGLRLSQIVQQVIHPNYPTAVWLGPGHPQEFLNNVPNAMIIDSNNEALKRELVDQFSSPLIRFYYGVDLIGNELGAALKNVIGIAAGILDGLNLSALKGALIARGPIEVSRIIQSQGGHPNSAYGLCHLGDYAATVFSEHSNNRQFGEAIVTNKQFADLAEGYYTAKAIYQLSQVLNLDTPICTTVYHILYNDLDPQQGIDQLFLRETKKEF